MKKNIILAFLAIDGIEVGALLGEVRRPDALTACF